MFSTENSNYLAHPFGVVHPSSLRCWVFVHNKYIHTFLKARIITNSNYLHRIISLSHIYQFFFLFLSREHTNTQFYLASNVWSSLRFQGTYIFRNVYPPPWEIFTIWQFLHLKSISCYIYEPILFGEIYLSNSIKNYGTLNKTDQLGAA